MILDIYVMVKNIELVTTELSKSEVIADRKFYIKKGQFYFLLLSNSGVLYCVNFFLYIYLDLKIC